MKALILSAGQGRRLLPLTREVPKCALEVAGASIVQRQIETLLMAGIEEIVIVTGHGARTVEELIKPYGDRVRAVFNPFYDISDNLASCWMARSDMDGDFILLNGDTLFELSVVQRLMESRKPITVTIDRKPEYDADDMKVRCTGNRVLRIGKQLPRNVTDGEAIGMIQFRRTGPATFRSSLAKAVRRTESLGQWYLSVVDEIAQTGSVHFCSIEGLKWAEVDTPEDLATAAAVMERPVVGQVAPLD